MTAQPPADPNAPRDPWPPPPDATGSPPPLPRREPDAQPPYAGQDAQPPYAGQDAQPPYAGPDAPPTYAGQDAQAPPAGPGAPAPNTLSTMSQPPPAPPPAQQPKPSRRMSAIIGGVVAAVVAIAVAFFLRGGGSNSMPAPDAWTTFTDPNGRFTIAMPKTPERETQQQQVEGVTLEVIAFAAEYSDAAVVVGYTDYPADLQLGAPEDVLQGAAQGAAQGTNGTLVSSTPTQAGGRPAMDAEIQAERGRVLSRLILDGNRLYILTTAGERTRPEIQQKLTDTFSLTGG